MSSVDDADAQRTTLSSLPFDLQPFAVAAMRELLEELALEISEHPLADAEEARTALFDGASLVDQLGDDRVRAASRLRPVRVVLPSHRLGDARGVRVLEYQIAYREAREAAILEAIENGASEIEDRIGQASSGLLTSVHWSGSVASSSITFVYRPVLVWRVTCASPHAGASVRQLGWIGWRCGRKRFLQGQTQRDQCGDPACAPVCDEPECSSTFPPRSQRVVLPATIPFA